MGGKYRRERLLGEGGMGNVWLAYNELLELPVAIKIMRPEVRSSEAAARFLTEARVQAKLRHPNVVRVFDYGETHTGDAYIVMELLEGCSLAEWLDAHGAFAPIRAVQMLLPVIDALCAAHRAGVIHRDLKPDNIFIASNGEQICPKLLDFGIAKLNDERKPRQSDPDGLIGSPAYMAPEQARGLPDVDHRADVWAACVVLYECITGKPAYDARNYAGLLRKVIECDLPPLQVPGTAGLWLILRAGLQRDRRLRIASMHELGLALADWLVSHGEQEDVCREPLGWRWSRVSQVASREVTQPRSVTPPWQQTGIPTVRTSVSPELAGRAQWLCGAPATAALRLGVGACIGASLLMLGMGQVEREAPPEPDAPARAVAASADAFAEVAEPRVSPPIAAALVGPPVALPVPPPAPVPDHPTPSRVETPLQHPLHPSAPAPAKPVLSVKRRLPASEAELGLKNPW